MEGYKLLADNEIIAHLDTTQLLQLAHCSLFIILPTFNNETP